MRRLLRWRGLAGSVRALIRRHVYDSAQYIITYNLCDGPPAPDHVGSIVFRPATTSDFDRLAELEPYGRGATTHRRYVEQDNDWLFVACDGERIVATRRASRVIRDRVISRVVELKDGQIWGADIFCLPEYRNRGIGRYLQLYGDRCLASLGYMERFGSINTTNISSLRASAAAGRSRLRFVSYSRILFWERVRVSPNIPDRFAQVPHRPDGARDPD